MATDPNFDIHDQVISERSDVGLNGTVTRNTVVRYYVGTHGPFVDVFESRLFTPAAAKAAMQKRQADLRATLT